MSRTKRSKDTKAVTSAEAEQRSIESYTHKDKKRINNPPVGLVTPETDKDAGKKRYLFDPHLDPELVWAGKAEQTSFEIPTLSLHVHERIDPRTIIESAKKESGKRPQLSLFGLQEENPPIRQAIEFYKHKHNWTNRLIAGDSLLVMNSLLEKEGLGGQVQMIYFDPPYGISYGSNFQPFTNRRDVKDGKDEHLTQEPEMIRAFRDTWQLGVHSYLSYVRDRLLLSRDLLSNSGSFFFQIGDENVHYVRSILDEIFGRDNFVSMITFQKTNPLGAKHLPGVCDYLLWYAKDKKEAKYRRLFSEKEKRIDTGSMYDLMIELSNGETRPATYEDVTEIPEGARFFNKTALISSGRTETCVFDVEFEGTSYSPGDRSWRTNREGMDRLIKAKRVIPEGKVLAYKAYHDDFALKQISNVWTDAKSSFAKKIYAVQTVDRVIARCILMSTDPGDLCLDITCGSGTTAYVAENWGRRWITCDTSRVAIAVTKERLMTSVFKYFQLARPDEGIASGLRYKTLPRVTLKSIANDEPPSEETLYDQPFEDASRVRVTGPFTVEAVPAPAVKSIDDIEHAHEWQADASISRVGETRRQSDWRDELLKTGIRGKQGQRIEFTRVEPIAGTRWLHADAETKEDVPIRVVVSFGPEYAPLEQRQVTLAIEEAQRLVPTPKIIVFAAFQFDPEAAKDVDETNWPGVTLLKAQMNADLLTEDLKKKRASNDSFWLIGQPDVEVRRLTSDMNAKLCVIVNGFDYYNTRTGGIESGGADRIAMWLLDTDYDGRSLFPRQVFFPMASEKDGWARLAKVLKAEIDAELIKQYAGTKSLSFEPGEHHRVAVKVIDDRGIESMKVIGV